MRKWPVRALEFPPLTLTFILALTLTLLPSASTQDEEKDCGQDRPCTAGLHVLFNGDEVPPCGQTLALDDTQVEPVLTLETGASDQSKDMLILMLDPDAPTDKTCVYFLHWVASATRQSNGTLTPEAIVDYFPPSPPLGQIHRYQLLLYPKPDQQVTAEKMGNFDLQKFKEMYDLGEPVASFQFRTEKTQE